MRVFVCASALALLAMSNSAWASCYNDAEAVAARVRVMQTDFMVAALSCDHRGMPEVRQRYTSFVKQYSGEMAIHARALIAYFQRTGGARALDTFVTSLANDMALRAGSTPNYCKDMLGKMDRGLTTKTSLATLAPAVGYDQSRGPGDCGKAAPVMVKDVIKIKETAKTQPSAPVPAPVVVPAAAPIVVKDAPKIKEAAKFEPPPSVTGPAPTSAPAPVENAPIEHDMGAGPDATRTGFAP